MKVMIHNPQRACCECESLTEAFSELSQMKQEKKETLFDFLFEHKQQMNCFKSSAGIDVLNSFVSAIKESQKAFTTDERLTIEQDALN